MTADRAKQAGFSQRIRLEWMELAAQLVDQGRTRVEIEMELQQALSQRLSIGSSAVRGNRGKVITILLRSWVTPPAEVVPLRDDAVEYLHALPSSTHVVLHWGLAMASYPFFGRVADLAGRQLQLQGRVVAAQVQRRVREQLGERETVARAARRVLRSFADWGVLQDSDVTGVYQGREGILVRDSAVGAWLLEALMLADRSYARPLSSLRDAAALFPFTLERLTPATISGNARLESFRQGMAEEMVALRGG